MMFAAGDFRAKNGFFRLDNSSTQSHIFYRRSTAPNVKCAGDVAFRAMPFCNSGDFLPAKKLSLGRSRLGEILRATLRPSE